jgi:flagellar biosynthesis protein FliR
MENEKIPVTNISQNTGNDSVPENSANKKKAVFWIIGLIVVIALIVFAVILLFQSDVQTTSKIRDIFIIFMALQSLIIGVALIILIVQLATLINVLKNEVKPILDTTNETVKNLRGTTTFLGNNLVEPVLKLNEYMAGLKKFFDLILPSGKSRHSK